MAFNKVSVALLLLIMLIVPAMATARVVLKASDAFQSASSWSECCNDCSCAGESCKCLDFRDGLCPQICTFCMCQNFSPPRCSCHDAIKRCPEKCTSTGAELKSFVASKDNN